MRKALLIVVIAVLGAACGGTESSDTPQTEPTAAATNESTAPATEAPDETTAPGTGSETSADEGEADPAAGAPSFDGPAAPDFQLALADGSTFSLTGEEKPVYMVFWAEW
jgi:hypothetical protein